MLATLRDVPDVVLWAPTATAALAVVAAGASWASVWQSRRIWQASLLPNLQVVVVFDVLSAPGNVWLRIENMGGGTAKRVGFQCTIRGALAAGHAGCGFLRPGEGLRVYLNFHAGGLEENEVAAMVVCSDVEETLHAWSHKGEHRAYGRSLYRRIQRRPRRRVGYDEAFAKFFPEVDLDTDERITWSWKEA